MYIAPSPPVDLRLSPCMAMQLVHTFAQNAGHILRVAFEGIEHHPFAEFHGQFDQEEVEHFIQHSL